MNKPGTSVTALLERLESEFETADGRTARLCRDARGNYWVIEGAQGAALALGIHPSTLRGRIRKLGIRKAR